MAVPHSLERQTEYGPVLGFEDTHPLRSTSSALEGAAAGEGERPPVLKYLGIPFAQAGRWEKPRAPESWKEPRPCYEFGTFFPQPPSALSIMYASHPLGFSRDFLGASESSHTLNIFAPAGTKPGDRLPVLVWVYGGALINGSADRAQYDPSEWLRREGEEAIIVSFNYRTNILGFLSSLEGGFEGNYGFHDCVSAFLWVQRNISSFGGDPGRVTGFGESAGAFLLGHLCVSGLNLFQRAVLQSGAPGTMSIKPRGEAYPPYEDVASALAGPEATAEQKVVALKAADPQTLVELHVKLNRGFSALNLTIEEGEGAIVGPAIERLKAAKWDDSIEGIILGTNEDEGSLFCWSLGLNSPEKFANYVTSSFPREGQADLKRLYKPWEGVEQTNVNCSASRLFGDRVFNFPVLNFADLVAGGSSEGRTKVWVYRLRGGVRYVEEKMGLGVMHAIDLPLLFDTNYLWKSGDPEEGTSKTLGDLWLSFAAHGNPDPDWKTWKVGAEEWLEIGEGGTKRNESVAEWKREERKLITPWLAKE